MRFFYALSTRWVCSETYASTAMTAPPVPHDNGNVQQQPESWDRPVEQASPIQAPPVNGDTVDTAKGASHTDDKHDAQLPAEAASHERTGSPAPDSASTSPTKADGSNRGEKQIKVLVESYFLTAITPVFLS